MNNHTLQYFVHEGPAAVQFELSGELTNDGARELLDTWNSVSAVVGKRVRIVDMTFVTGASQWARALLARWHGDGAQIIARSKDSLELAEDILGRSLNPAPANPALNWTWSPIGPRSAAARILTLFVLAVLFLAVPSRAANLNSGTVAARGQFVDSATTNLPEHVRPGGSFRRRVWRNSQLMPINQTAAASRRSSQAHAAPAGLLARTGDLRGSSAVLGKKTIAFTGVE